MCFYFKRDKRRCLLGSFFLSKRVDKVIINAHAVYKVLSVCLSVVFGEEYLAHNASPLSRFSQRERERETRRSGKEYNIKCFFSDLN